MGLSIRAYARHRGVSDAAVRKAIAAGRITPNADGTLDPAQVDAQWSRNTEAPRVGSRTPAARAPVPTDAAPSADPGAALPAGGEYRLHHDCFEHDPLATSASAPIRINQRAATAIIYLNDDFDGGATAFPAMSLAVLPVAGQLLQFDNLLDGQPDPQMRHAGEPIRRGEKRILTFWFRERPLVERD